MTTLTDERREQKREMVLTHLRIARKHGLKAMQLWDELEEPTPHLQTASAISCLDDAADTGSDE